MANATCSLCNSKNSRLVLKDSDRHTSIKTIFNVYKCGNCRSLFLWPKPTIEELRKHYDDSYYSLSGTEQKSKLDFLYQIYYRPKNLLKQLVFSPLKPLIDQTTVIPGGRFLDIGCGAGSFLKKMKEFDMKVYGVKVNDFDEKQAEQHGLNIYKSELQQAKYDDDFFDVIRLYNTLEHVQDPNVLLEEIYRILKPNGTLHIKTPAVDNLAFIVFGRYWEHLEIPRHLHIYSRTSIRKDLKGKGFKNIKIKDSSQFAFQYVGSMINWILRKKKKQSLSQNKIVNSFLWMPFNIISGVLNLIKLGDEIEIKAKK